MNLAATLQLIATLLIGFGVGARYLGRANISFLNELALLLACWIAFLGAAEGIRTHYHVAVDLVTSRLPQRVQAVIDFAVCLVLLAGFGLLTFFGYEYLFSSTSRLQSINLSRRPLIAAMPVGFTFMTYYMLVHAVTAWRGLRDGRYTPPSYTPEDEATDTAAEEATIARLYASDAGEPVR